METKQLNIYRVWEIMNLLSDYEAKLSDEDVFVHLLGNNSEYYTNTFEHFLEYYSFRFEDDELCVFNNDPIPWGDDNNIDFSYLKLSVLELSDQEILELAEKMKEEQLQQQKLDKIAEKRNIEAEIERLKKQLEKYE